MSGIGMGVILGMLEGNEETVNAIEKSIGHKIKDICVAGNELVIQFYDSKTLSVYDDGQTCCEKRYMTTDDNCDCHDTQFLEVTTSKGCFQVVNHNEHNGYYGGFLIRANLEDNGNG